MSQNKAVQDQLLTEASNGYFPKGFICEQALPLIGVKQYTGKLGKYGDSHLRIETSITGGKGSYRRVETITRSTDSYSIDSHGLEGLVTKRDYANVQKPFDAENDEQISLTGMLYLEKEKGLADVLTNTAIITQNVTLAGTDQYSDKLNSDPLSDFSDARIAIRNGCGALANVAMMDWAVYNVLKYHPQLLDFLGYKQSRPGGLSIVELANAMEVEKILIAQPVYNASKEGQATSLAACWGKHIVFGVLPEKAEVRQVSLGYRLQIAGSAPRKVYTYMPGNPPEAKAILVEDEYSMFIQNAAAGYLIKNAIA